MNVSAVPRELYVLDSSVGWDFPFLAAATVPLLHFTRALVRLPSWGFQSRLGLPLSWS
jgi:hypothetical protein